MALFDNVTYTFYSDVLGRSEVPNEEAFNRFALENKLYAKSLVDDGLLTEREENGIDSAVCMMIEEDFKRSQILSGETALKASESIGGYSFSRSTKAHDAEVEKDTATLAQRKCKWLSLYCELNQGVL